MDFDLEFVGVAFILVFSAVFLSAWNFSFPSTLERDLWRVSSIYMLSYGFVGAAWMEFAMWIFVPQNRLAQGLELSLVEQELDKRPHPIRDSYFRLQNWRRKTTRRSIDLDQDSLMPRQPRKGCLAFLSRSHNISHGKDPYMNVQVGFIIVTSVLCAFYCVFRVYIFVEDFVGLRALPLSAYQTVEWTKFIPHI